MFYKKSDFPEENEILVCTIKKVLPNCVFVTLDEYNKEGLIHISEISPGRIRNIRDYVREGKKIVCKVLKIDEEKNHIDLSLRRVNKNQRINKNAEYKQEQKAEKILELVAQELEKDLAFIYKEAGYKIIEKYGSLTTCFQEIVKHDSSILKEINIPDKITKSLTALVKKRIKPKEVTINSTLILSSNEPNGIEIIKEILGTIQNFAIKNKYKLKIQYISAPKYYINITAPDYKTAEKEIKELTEITLKNIKGEGYAEFIRNDKKDTQMPKV